MGLTLFSPVAVSAPAAPMVFSHLTVQDGLSQNTVLDIFQDSVGYVWVATESGLNRFDGYNFEHYTQDRTNPDALQSDFVWGIAEDSHQDLWLATKGGGLVRWLRREDRFETFRHDPNDATTIASDAVRAVWVGEDDTVWAGTRGGGLNRLDPQTGVFTRYRHDPDNAASLSNDSVNAIIADGRGHLWVGTRAGLNVMNVATEKFMRYQNRPDDPTSLSNDVVISVFQDDMGTLWVGTFEGGLNRFDSVTNRFVRYRHNPDDTSSLSHDYVWGILQDRDGRFWVGTQNGLNLFDRQSESFTRYQKSPTDPNSLSSSYVMSMYQDASGLLWLGTRGGGISQWHPRSWSLGHFKDDQLKDAMTVAIATDREQRVWIGALGAPLGRLDRKSGELTPLSKLLPEGVALSDARAMSLLHDEDGTLWVGTMTGGLNHVDLRRGTIEVYQHDPNDATSLGANGIMTMLSDGESLWIGTFGGGVNRFDRKAGTFERFEFDPDDPSSLSSPRATALAKDARGRIWVGTDDAGLNVLDPATGTVHRLRHDPAVASSLSSDGIYSLHVDNDGNIWVGTTDSGLDRVVDPDAAPGDVRFTNRSQIHGLSGNTVYGVQSDADGSLWVSGKNGLTKFDPASGAVRVYHRRHGLQGDEFNFGAHHRDARGWLYFGGANGINMFDPQALAHGDEAPAVVVTAIEKFNQAAPLDQPYDQVTELALDYSDDVITFEFAALDYIDPSKNRYRYRLEGFDKNWVEIGNRRRVTYTNLDAGTYTFKVAAANSDGTWNDNGAAIRITVAPAPWETPLAFALYALIALAVVGGIFLWQHRRLKAAAQLRQLAYYDSLSGLPNIKLFRQRLSESLDEARQLKDGLALLYVDLDRFKRINDTLGHTVGDNLIKSVSSRLSQCVHRRGEGVGQFELARISGDEFLIFLRHRHARREAREMAKDIAQSLSAPFASAGQDLVVTASIGAALYPDHGEDGESLLKAADTAVAQAKAEGRRTFRLYSRKMSARAMQRLSLENEIRLALENDQFQLYFQPKYRAGDLKIIGAEALLRWFHPTRGEISPGNFISVAEEAGQISDLSRWVVRTACRQLRAWQDEGLPQVPIAVNLSPEDFLRDDPVGMVRSALAESDIDAHLLSLEITESALMHDTSRVSQSLRDLKALGCELSVDDFGTGYSSLAYLKRFPLDTLKIDRSFVSDISTDADAASICSAIIAMGRALSLNVVAEGVETDQQLRRLRLDGCDQFQGFLLSRPVPSSLFMEQLIAQSPSMDQARIAEQKVVQLSQR